MQMSALGAKLNSTIRPRTSPKIEVTYSVVLVFLLFTVFLLPSSLKPVSSIAFAGAVLLMVGMQGSRLRLFTRLRPGLLPLLLALIFVVLVAFIFSPWPKSMLLTATAFLILSVLTFGGTVEIPKRTLLVERIFYIVALTTICRSIVSNYGGLNSSYTAGGYDKNYFGIILFTFFCWCWVTGRKIGVVVCVLSAPLLGSRNYVIMLALFFALAFVQRRHTLKSSAFDGPEDDESVAHQGLSAVRIFAIFVAMLLTITAFSFWWSESVVGPSTSSYGQSMNDSSNAIRTNSNKYGILYLLEHRELMLYGYDGQIVEAMGLVDKSELDGTETALTGTFYDDYRVVQPHHVVVNMLLKEGVLFTVVYFAILSVVLSNYLRKDNLCLWVPYLFGCMFMHSLLVGYYLLFFLLVLARARPARRSKDLQPASGMRMLAVERS